MVLQTKLFKAPPPRGEIRRERLTHKLEQGTGGSVSIIVAGAGYGKSTAAAQWLDATDTAFAWLSVDSRDNSPTRFWRSVAESLAATTGGVGATVIEALRSSEPPTSIAAADRLVAELAQLGGESTPIALVIDDYHHITDSDIHDGVTRLVSFLPTTCRLVLLSRTKPALPVARWRTTGRVIEIGSKDLALHNTELRSMVAATSNLELTSSEIKTLHARTEGWPAAVQLALLSLRESEDKAAALTDFGGSLLLLSEYLLSEVFGAQEQQLQEFCVLTSVVRRMSAPLCEAIVNAAEGHGETFLEDVVERGLLVIALDNKGMWYRYHDLFREFLETRAKRVPNESLRAARQRAAAWFESNGHFDDALEQLLQLQEFESAGRLLLLSAGARFRIADYSELAASLDALPAEVRDRSPALLTATAWTLPDGRQMRLGPQLIDRADELLAEAARLDGEHVGPAHAQIGVDSANARDQVLSEIYMMRSYLVRSNRQFSLATDYARRSIELSRPGGLPLRARAYCGLGQDLLMRGEMVPAVEAFEVAMDHALDEQELVSVIMILGYSVICDWQRGSFDSAVRVVRRIGTWLRERNYKSLAIARWQRGALFPVFLERWQLEDAKGVLDPVLSYVHGAPHQRIVIYQRHANLLRAAGDYEGAGKALDTVEEHFHTTRSLYTYGWASIAAQRAELAVLRNQPEQALIWLDSHNKTETNAGKDFLGEADRWAAGFVNAHVGDAQRGIAAMDEIRADCLAHDRLIRSISCDVVAAVAYQRLGQIHQARDRFEQALNASAKVGAVRVILNSAGPAGAELLRHNQSAGTSPSWTAHLLTCCQQQAKGPVWKAEELAEPLSQRELQALAFVARGLRNADIANEMGIRESTVKVHLRNLYGKLGVKRRTQALSRARELGLLHEVPTVAEQ